MFSGVTAVNCPLAMILRKGLRILVKEVRYMKTRARHLHCPIKTADWYGIAGRIASFLIGIGRVRCSGERSVDDEENMADEPWQS